MKNETFIYQEKIRSGTLPKTILRCLVYLLNYWRTLPCQVAYLISSRKQLVNSDFGSYRNIVRTLVFSKHNRNLFYHRMGRSSILYSWLLPGENSLKLPFSCKLGMHAIFVHNDSCHLNAERIGDHFVCYPHVVIGSKSLSSKKKPTIGNNVTIGTGAVIVGDISIGSNVKIAANSFVCESVPNNCIVKGNPSKCLLRSES